MLILVLLAMVPAFIVLDGLVIRDCWNWFVSPVFKITAVTLIQAIGLSCTWNVFSLRHSPKKSVKYSKNQTTQKVLAILEAKATLLLFWFTAFVIHRFFM